MVDWNRIRTDFPVTKDKVYFISAGMSPVPNQVFDRIVREYRGLNEYGDIFWEKDVEANRVLRSRIGGLIGATADDLAFVHNTSTVMSMLALSLKNDLEGDFNVISMMDEFPASTVPFEYQGIEMKYVEPVAARYSMDSILGQIDDRTVAVLTSCIQYATGFRQDLERLGAELKKRKVMFIVNATQAFPFFPLNVKNMHIDAMSCSLHKWGLTGHVGTIFYTSPAFRKKFRSPMAGWLSIDTGDGDFVYMEKNQPIKVHESADRYMLGCINLQLVNSLGSALDYLEEIGLENVRERIFELTDYLIEQLKSLNVEIISPIEKRNERSAAVSFNVGDRTAEMVPYLESGDIYVSYRNGKIRVSVNIFNNHEDIDRLISVMKDFLKM